MLCAYACAYLISIGRRSVSIVVAGYRAGYSYGFRRINAHHLVAQPVQTCFVQDGRFNKEETVGYWLLALGDYIRFDGRMHYRVELLQQRRFGKHTPTHVGRIVLPIRKSLFAKQLNNRLLHCPILHHNTFSLRIAVVHRVPAPCEFVCNRGFATAYTPCDAY